ncbi:zinc finger CCCH domain-containing protein 2-like [Zingiber officinale]|uniref:C3H1-type domain-containing protein n=1 Tax=Zingiber officinale TaxID=94328 RepID=A0A8J5BFR2_ZINOF|nr:zinc finger CCCH domain-containing protein 2-like [Zingiber officinale]KAG6471301.1 hypothetical protein ZIOFF_068742 [Zingiber officinale]
MEPGEQFHGTLASHTLPWSLSEDYAAGIQPSAALPVGSFAGLPTDLHPHLIGDVSLALQRFIAFDDGSSPDSTEADVFSSDYFRVYEFKIRRCPRGRSHDWTECPYAHPGEKARRRDPRRFHYSGTPCSDFRQGGGCRRGEGCEYAHGVFETWLHPARYRTQPCKDGAACLRRVCFFAHSPKELRIVLLTSPVSPGKGGCGILLSASPTSTLAPTPISPLSDGSSPPLSPMAIDEVVGTMTKLRLSKLRSMTPFETRRPASAARALRTAETRDIAEEAAADAWSMTAKLLECRRREEAEAESAAAPDLGWVSELVKD